MMRTRTRTRNGGRLLAKAGGGAAAPAPTPYPLTLSPALWLPSGPARDFQDAGKLTPCAALDPVYTAADASGNGRDAVQSDPSGRPVLDGAAGAWSLLYVAGNRLATADDPALNPAGSFAVNAWAKLSSFPAAASMFAAKGTAEGDGTSQYALYYSQTAGGFRFFAMGADDTLQIVTAAGPPALDTWYMVTGRFTGSAVEIYVDGTLAGSAAATHGLASTRGTGLYTGQDSAGHYQFFGRLDQTAVYPGLTPTEIAGLLAYGHGGG